MTMTAPLLSGVDLSDPDEQMKVTNNGSKVIEWDGVRRTYRIPPKKSEFIPFHVIVRYLGDPRSDYKKVDTFQTPSGQTGVIPERRGELIRLSVIYGLYHDKIAQLASKAPKCTVETLNGVKINFPVYDPKSSPYPYQTNDSRNIDVRTEIDRLRAQNEATEAKLATLLNNSIADDDDGGEATDDGHLGMG